MRKSVYSKLKALGLKRNSHSYIDYEIAKDALCPEWTAEYAAIIVDIANYLGL